jgi:hypothetical protein
MSDRTIRSAILALSVAGRRDYRPVLDATEAWKKWFYRDEENIPWPVPTWEEFGELKDVLVRWADSHGPANIDVGGPVKRFYQMHVERCLADHDPSHPCRPSDAELRAAALGAIGAVDRLANWLRERAATSKDQPGPKAKRPSKLAQAMGMLHTHPGWSTKKIAERVGCNPKYLSQCRRFTEAKKAIKRLGKNALPRGTKTRAGDLEAEDKEG